MNIKFFESEEKWKEYNRCELQSNVIYVYYDKTIDRYGIIFKTDKLTGVLQSFHFTSCISQTVDLVKEHPQYLRMALSGEKVYV